MHAQMLFIIYLSIFKDYLYNSNNSNIPARAETKA